MGIKRLYRAVSPYPDTAIKALDYAQNLDQQYLAHSSYAPQKLSRYAHTDWRFSTVTFGPTLPTPTLPGVVATKPNTSGAFDTNAEYAVTYQRSSTLPAQESRLSPSSGVIGNDLTLQGNYNTVNMPGALPPGADRFIVYKKTSGGFGYIGYTTTSTFRDGSPAIQPVLSETAPSGYNPFGGAGNYPCSVVFHQQRLLWGGTTNVVNGVWGSRSADFENFDKSSPVKADDSLAFALNTGQVNSIQYLVSFKDLLVFTSDAIFSVAGDQGGVMTPGDINPMPQTNRGSARLKPLPIDSMVMFQPARGSGVRTLGYTFDVEGYKSNEISIFSPHLFTGFGIIAWAYQEEPFSVVWAVRNDGVLLAFTWQEEQQVWGWTPMEIDGEVEDVVTIPEDGFMRVYILVKRNLLGVTRRFIERMALPSDEAAESCHLDCSITRRYDEPSNVVDHLWHLEGCRVSATYDGYVASNLLVQNGRITLPGGAKGRVVSVGLPYQGRIETLPPALLVQGGTLQTNRQEVGEITVRALNTYGIEIGASNTPLEQLEPLDGDDMSQFPTATLRDRQVPAQGNWDSTCSVVIEQNVPLPAHIVGIFYDVKISRN